ncbi:MULTISPECIES: SDR family NAD(P)-dependent oxidoreductase [unclassified Anaerobiospirillum]|uniref:SDR family NAD(P)-dependent oxidoreductase n=1 Tax=unclassified Anaerobiospirillum TaxID=2647410 RepID=UPI001FF582CF|nr:MULTISPECIES: SDR family NAD(P)-dependent oxidoreductase [unclassified Anaerobiospirillum]MCK0533670.1 SDR family NAD(P)-dependent oxidoreductase [Anaerobiospirillum sp. NML120511]MCK0539633.1 SDR family NAD(P)-dependent oxidoreductase [Anaerobiospirillum sp. NML02-A-032]
MDRHKNDHCSPNSVSNKGKEPSPSFFNDADSSSHLRTEIDHQTGESAAPSGNEHEVAAPAMGSATAVHVISAHSETGWARVYGCISAAAQKARHAADVVVDDASAVVDDDASEVVDDEAAELKGDCADDGVEELADQADTAVRHMVVLGASSEIAIAAIKEFARTGSWRFSLCGRNMTVLERTAVELTSTHGCQCSCHYFDTGMPNADMKMLWQRLTAEANQVSESEEKVCSGVDTLFCAAGYLGNQHWAEHDPAEGEEIMRSNCTGLMPLVSAAASYFEERRHGCIMVITSVAGDRGRCSNYFYGASKAAMSAFLSGLRVRLYQSGVSVVDIRPGYVRTRMVAGRKLPPYITAPTETVARDIVRAWHTRPAVLYTMWLWRYIMCVTRHIPDFIFKRLNMF